MNLFVDPVVLAVPQSHNTIDDYRAAVTEYCLRLEQWALEAYRSKKHKFYISSACIGAMHIDNCYPHSGNLRACWTSVSDEEPDLSFDMIATLVHRVVSNDPALEEIIPEMGMEEADVEIGTMTVQPEIFVRLTETVAHAFRHGLALLAWASKRRAKQVPAVTPDFDPETLLLVSHPVPHKDSALVIRAEMRVCGENDVEHGTVDSDLLLITEPEQLEDLMGLEELWNDPEAALQWRARQMGVTDLASYAFGPNFVSTLAEYGFSSNMGYLDKVYRLCVGLLKPGSIRYSKQHHVMTNKGADLQTGRWQAYRLWINNSTPGYRLVYWNCGSEYLFMHVRVHDNYDIDPPIRE